MNDIFKIKPVKIKGGNKLPVKGKELISNLYANIFLAARTNSGKTTLINHLLKHTIDERTTVLIFSSTVDIDNVWLSIQKSLKRRKIQFQTFTSIWEDNCNMLEEFLTAITTPNEKEEEIKQEIHPIINADTFSNPEKPEKKQRKKVYKNIVPEFLIIMDDLNKEDLRSPCLVNLLKKNRHYHARCIVSSQALIHMAPDAFSQLSDLIIWNGFSREYIKKVWDRVNISEDFNTFWKLYTDITSKKYSFMNIDLRNSIVKNNFVKIKV